MVCKDSSRIGRSRNSLLFRASHNLKRSRHRFGVVRATSRRSHKYSSSLKRSLCSRSIVAGRRECGRNLSLLLKLSRRRNHQRNRRRSGRGRENSGGSRNLLLKLNLNLSLSHNSGVGHNSKLRLLRPRRRRSLNHSHSSGVGHNSKLRLPRPRRRRSLSHSHSSGVGHNSRRRSLNPRLLLLRSHGHNLNHRLRLGLNRSRAGLSTRAEAKTEETNEATESSLSG
jgi:hypothetical protein